MSAPVPSSLVHAEWIERWIEDFRPSFFFYKEYLQTAKFTKKHPSKSSVAGLNPVWDRDVNQGLSGENPWETAETQVEIQILDEGGMLLDGTGLSKRSPDGKVNFDHPMSHLK